MKRMLINATQEEELRMAMVDGQRLYDLNIEAPASERKKANIYKGKITRIEPSLEAAFVEYGSDRHGFLPLKEISSEYFVKENKSGGKPSIKDVLKEGQDIVVQVDKEERGNKGAALTTFVSLAGRFIVLKPNKDRSGGVSRRITGGDRDLARKSLNEIIVPDGMSVILRTAGIDRSAEELAWDLENLLTVWTAILNVVLERPSPFLIYRESDSVVRALRDYLTTEIGEILIDDEATYKDAHEFVEQVMPHNLKKLKHYVDPVPLFTRFQIETQIESAFAHTVTLPSGGSIVIDHTEALVSVDINSARATRGGDIEATALNTNLEAADEVARQLRIRDLGGLVVIDFIDMGPQKNQREVENRLREAVRQDRARVQIGKISRFGLLEMSRQRLRPSIGESAYHTCPRCSGFGTIRSVESLALAILRIIGEEARKERTSKVIAQLPVEVATYLLNEKRDWVQSLESRNDTHVVLVANSALETPHYEVRRVRDDQLELAENKGVSYELPHTTAEPETPQAILERKAIEQPVVGTMKPTTQAPKPQQPPRKGLLATLMGFFSGDEDEKKVRQPRQKGSGGNRARRAQQTRRRGSSDSRQTSDKRRPQRKKTTKKAASKKSSSKKTASKKTAAKKKAATGGARRGKPQQQGDQQKAAQQKTKQDTTDETRSDSTRSSRNRRSRGGRRRRRTADKPEQATSNQPQATDSANQPQKADNKESTPPQKVPATRESKQDAGTPQKAPATRESKQDAGPPQKTPATQEPKQDAGPPRARTDEQRSRDTAKLDDTASHKALKPEVAIDKTPKPPTDNGGSTQPTSRLLPWEAQTAADIKPPSKSDAPKPSPKPEAVHVAEKAPVPKPDSKPAEPAAE
ncbi:MAG: Rne/Rng family ribonuclease [Gammaproteobacteria bacterium]|nr:Rne/Rng family ribonuclease [Gammaproteobacteria bacterium]NNC58274.1 Rne/Rng family ribonuclease [Woeseiaceae bacterium]NNL50631.1 Rne/Rng family ribonuclease [Woeseiaceae bacterium]